MDVLASVPPTGTYVLARKNVSIKPSMLQTLLLWSRIGSALVSWSLIVTNVFAELYCNERDT